MSERQKSLIEVATERMHETNRKPANDRMRQPGDKPTLDDVIPDRTPEQNGGV
jgi:hypothetical protein